MNLSSAARLGRRLILLLAVASTLVHAAPGHASETWRSIVGLPRVAHDTTEATAADLDGDGIDEFVLTLGLGRWPEAASSSALGVVANEVGSAWSIRALALFDAAEFGAPLVMRRPGGDAIVVHSWRRYYAPSYTEAYEMLVLGGFPPRVERRFILDHRSEPVATGDVDADGDDDIVELVTPQYSSTTMVRARDAGTGDVLWTRSTDTVIRSAALAQLDGDAALEVLVASALGEVFDGMLGLTEWTYPAGFDQIVAGRFDTSAPISFAAVTSLRVVYFRQAPLSPVDESTHAFGYPSGIVVANFDADDAHEIAVADGNRIGVLDRGATPREVASGNLAYSFLAGGQADQDEAIELATIGSDFGAQWHFVAFDADTGDEAFRFFPHLTHAGHIVAGDLEGTGEARVLTLDTGWTSYGDTVYARLFDATDGTLLRDARIASEFSMPWYDGLQPGQLDADPALELVVGVTSGGNGYVAIDLATLQAERVGFSGTVTQELLRASQVADIDADGSVEIVSVKHSGNTAGVDVRDATGGQIEWQSIGITDFGAASLAIVQADADAARELILFAGGDLYAFDSVTHLLEWSRDLGDGTEATEMAVRDIAGDCEITVHDASESAGADDGMRLRQFDCLGRPTRDRVIAGREFTRLRYLPAPGAPLVGLRSSRLEMLDLQRRTTQPLSDHLGPNAGERGVGLGVARGDNGDAVVLSANDGSVRAFSVALPMLFADGFE